MKQNKHDDRNLVTFKEFWALVMAQYALALPKVLIMILVLLITYFVIGLFISK